MKRPGERFRNGLMHCSVPRLRYLFHTIPIYSSPNTTLCEHDLPINSPSHEFIKRCHKVLNPTLQPRGTTHCGPRHLLESRGENGSKFRSLNVPLPRMRNMRSIYLLSFRTPPNPPYNQHLL